MMRYISIKKLYVASAAVILLAAVVITSYFVDSGLKAKDNSAEDSSQNNSLSNTQQDADNNATPLSYNLLLTKIGVSVPIITNVDGNNQEEYNKALENGVAQLRGSALPGKNGNSFIFGHSSYYENKPGNYKQIFAELNDLIPGDLIEVQSGEANFVYRITNKKVVEPSDVSVAAQNVDLTQITLMTCWPIGSTAQRLIVVGELIQ